MTSKTKCTMSSILCSMPSATLKKTCSTITGDSRRTSMPDKPWSRQEPSKVKLLSSAEKSKLTDSMKREKSQLRSLTSLGNTTRREEETFSQPLRLTVIVSRSSLSTNLPSHLLQSFTRPTEKTISALSTARGCWRSMPPTRKLPSCRQTLCWWEAEQKRLSTYTKICWTRLQTTSTPSPNWSSFWDVLEGSMISHHTLRRLKRPARDHRLEV